MAEPPLFTEKEARLLSALLRNKVDFMVVALSAAMLQGAPVVTQNVDLWFKDLGDERLKTALKEVGVSYVPPFELMGPMLAGAGAELFDIVIRMDGLGTFVEECPNAVHIDLQGEKIPVLSLERIIKSKEATNRPKDQIVMSVLRDTLRTEKVKDSASI